MSEKKRSIPKPTIRTAPPVKPSVRSIDVQEAQAPEAKMEEEAEKKPVEALVSSGVETDLVKRFLAALIDGIVASFIAYLVGAISGSSLLSYLIFGIIMLIKDSLPFLEGQSIGKKAMKIKAVKEDGSSLSGDWVTGGTRNILLAIPVAGIVECFILLTRSGNPGAGMRLGDDWAKTKVISLE